MWKPRVLSCFSSLLCSYLRILIYFAFFSYVPTRLWGFSGHVQTVVHSILGRLKCPWPIGERCCLHLADGSTLTYDLYQPLNQTFEGMTYLSIYFLPSISVVSFLKICLPLLQMTSLWLSVRE